MTKARTAARPKKPRVVSPLVVRLDAKSKRYLTQAAQLRHISVSDYVRIVTIPQARREVEGARNHTIVMTPEEQLEFWNALNEPPNLTKAQRELGAIMRGKA